MENKIDGMNTRVMNQFSYLVNTVLANISNQNKSTLDAIGAMQRDVSAIKTKVGAL